jgi:hypothetical protein
MDDAGMSKIVLAASESRHTLIRVDAPVGDYAFVFYATSIEARDRYSKLSPEARRDLEDCVYSALKGALLTVERGW